MSAQTLVKLDSESEPLPLHELEWACIAPCGCMTGCMIVETTDADAAALEFWGTKDQRARHLADGYLMRLERRDTVMEQMLSKQRCPHVAERRVPVPAGHRWAERPGSRRGHLVPDDDAKVINEKRDIWMISGRVAALCETSQPDRWRDGWGNPSWANEHPQCRRCEKLARERAS